MDDRRMPAPRVSSRFVLPLVALAVCLQFGCKDRKTQQPPGSTTPATTPGRAGANKPALAGAQQLAPERDPGTDQPGVADRPVIMTGGSLQIWSAGDKLKYEYVNGVHVYTHDASAAPIKRIKIRFPQQLPCPFPICKHENAVGMAIWYVNTDDTPDISVEGGSIKFPSTSANAPLAYSGLGSAPYESGNIQAHRYDHVQNARKISYIRVFMPSGRYWDYPVGDDNQPRIQIHYQ